MTLKIDLSNKEIAEIETDKDASVTANWDLLYSVEASTYCGTRANPRPGGSVYCPFKTEQDSSAGLTTVDLWCQYRFQDTLFEDLTTGTLFLSNKTLSGSFQCGGEFSSDLTYDFKFSNCVSP